MASHAGLDFMPRRDHFPPKKIKQKKLLRTKSTSRHRYNIREGYVVPEQLDAVLWKSGLDTGLDWTEQRASAAFRLLRRPDTAGHGRAGQWAGRASGH